MTQHRSPSSIPKVCPECGAKVTTEHEAPYQEYPGASVQGGSTYIACTACDWEDTFDDDLSDFPVREMGHPHYYDGEDCDDCGKEDQGY